MTSGNNTLSFAAGDFRLPTCLASLYEKVYSKDRFTTKKDVGLCQWKGEMKAAGL